MLINRPNDQKADIWSAGVVFYYLISNGALPFEKGDEDMVINTLCDELKFEDP